MERDGGPAVGRQGSSRVTAAGACRNIGCLHLGRLSSNHQRELGVPRLSQVPIVELSHGLAGTNSSASISNAVLLSGKCSVWYCNLGEDEDVDVKVFGGKQIKENE